MFLSLCLAMMVASLLETILITNLLCGSAHYSPVPRWIRVLVLQILGRLVRLQPKPRDLEDTVLQNPAAQGRMPDLGCGFTQAKLFMQSYAVWAVQNICTGQLKQSELKSPPPSSPLQQKWKSPLWWQRTERLQKRRDRWMRTRPFRSWGAWAWTSRPSTSRWSRSWAETRARRSGSRWVSS